MLRKLFIVLCVWCLHIGIVAAAPDFAAVDAAVERYRAGKTDLRVTFDAKEFRVLEGTRQPVSAEELKRLENPVLAVGNRGPAVMELQRALKGAGHFDGDIDGEFGPATKAAVQSYQKSRGLAADGKVGPGTRSELGLSAAADWKATGELVMTDQGPGLRYQVSNALELEMSSGTKGEDPGASWTKISTKQIAHRPREQWMSLMDTLVARGLLIYETSTHKDKTSIGLTFAAADARQPIGPDRLTLSPAALRFLKLSSEHPARLPRGREWVILVHEPHWSISGHVQLVAGLKELAAANPALKLQFLVEGDRPDRGCRTQEPCDIPAKSIAELLSEDPSARRQQVQYLLRKHLIDSPLAYRLLYDSVPAVAIDDDEALSRSPQRTLDPTATWQTLRDVDAALSADKSAPQAEAARQRVRLLTVRMLMRPNDVPERIALLDTLRAEARSVASDLRKIDAARYGKRAAALEQYASSLIAEKQVYEQVAIRDDRMVKGIVAHFAKANQKRTPVAFIGSAHTVGMIKLLPAHYGYVVIEPRITDYVSAERKSFDVALHDYPSALASAERQLRKLAVLPRTSSLPALGELAKRVETKVASRPALAIEGMDAAKTDAIRDAVDQNAFFNLADVHVANNNGGQLPPMPPGTFASFTPGEGRHGKLVLMPGKDRRWDDEARSAWQRADRLDYLRNVVLFTSARAQESGVQSREVVLFRDPNTHRTFACFYDPEQRTYYFAESARGLDGMDALIGLPSGVPDAHVRLSEILRALRQRGQS